MNPIYEGTRIPHTEKPDCDVRLTNKYEPSPSFPNSVACEPTISLTHSELMQLKAPLTRFTGDWIKPDWIPYTWLTRWLIVNICTLVVIGTSAITPYWRLPTLVFVLFAATFGISVFAFITKKTAVNKMLMALESGNYSAYCLDVTQKMYSHFRSSRSTMENFYIQCGSGYKSYTVEVTKRDYHNVKVKIVLVVYATGDKQLADYLVPDSGLLG